MKAYSGTEAAQEKAQAKIRDKNHDGIVEPDEKPQPQLPAAKAPGTGTVLDITA